MVLDEEPEHLHGFESMWVRALLLSPADEATSQPLQGASFPAAAPRARTRPDPPYLTLPHLPPLPRPASRQDDKPEGGFEILAKMPGSELVGLRYTPLFPFFSALAAAEGSSKGAFRVVSDTYVTDDSGTGVVHQVGGWGGGRGLGRWGLGLGWGLGRWGCGGGVWGGGAVLGVGEEGKQYREREESRLLGLLPNGCPHHLFATPSVQAPAFGEDDYRVCLAHGVCEKGDSLPCPVDLNGRFTEEVGQFKGL